MAVHSRVGGSKAAQWMNCAGSVPAQSRLERESPEYSSEFAEEGTQAHKVAELIATGWEPGPGVDKDMVRFGRQYAAGIRMLEHFYPGKGLLEARVHAPDFSPDMFGFLDYALPSIRQKTLVVLDYKYGAGEYVDVVHNAQLMDYDLMASETFGYFENSVQAIFQPRGPNPGWRFWSPSLQERLEFRGKVKQALEAIKNGSVETNAGTWCRWCTAKAICPAFIEKHLAPILATEGNFIGVGMKRIAEIYDSHANITQWMKSAEKYLKTAVQMSDEGEVEGYFLKKRKGKTSWRNQVDIEVAHPAKEFPDFYKTVLKTPNQIIELHPEFKDLLEYSYIQPEFQNLAKAGSYQSGEDE